MEVKNCKTCGRLFNYMSGPVLCQGCQKKLEEKFQEVRAYLEENRHATVSEVSEELDVSVKQIKQWIREERLSLSEASVDGVTCERCGVPITSGRFCDKCKAKMQNELTSVIVKPPTSDSKRDHDGNRMRFLK